MRRAALRSALTVKAKRGDIILLESIDIDTPRTRQMAATMGKLVDHSTALLILAERNENVQKSIRNLPGVKTLLATYLNVRDLLGYDKLVLSLSALELLNGLLGSASERAWSYVEAGEEE